MLVVDVDPAKIASQSVGTALESARLIEELLRSVPFSKGQQFFVTNFGPCLTTHGFYTTDDRTALVSLYT